MADIVYEYGAVGDGKTDNTAALQEALDSGDEIHLSAGTFLSGPLTVKKLNTRIFGQGDKSIIKLKPGSSGTLLHCGQQPVRLKEFKLAGGSASDKRFLIKAEDDRKGVMIAPEFNSRIESVTIDGFGFAGMVLADQAADAAKAPQTLGNYLQIRGCAVTNCYQGILVTESLAAEYVIIEGNDLNSHTKALVLRSRNALVTGNSIKSNGAGIELDGSSYTNNGHGIISNNLINHSVNFSLCATRISKGMNITGNQMQLGNILLDRCSGINISDGTISVAEINLKGGGRNYIRNNYVHYVENLPNKVTHNLDGLNDATAVENNWTSSGLFPNSYGAAF